MTRCPVDAYLRSIGEFVFFAAELEARILADERTPEHVFAPRRRDGESTNEFHERIVDAASVAPPDFEAFLRSSADALYEIAVWRERLVRALPSTGPAGETVLVREDDEPLSAVQMGREHLARLRSRLADWHRELDRFERPPSRAEAMWGVPDEQGRYLVRIVELGDDASEDDYSAAGNMQLAAIRQAAEEYYARSISAYEKDRFYRLNSSPCESPMLAELADGTMIATKQAFRRGPGWQRDLRKPTPQEHACWAGTSEPRVPTPALRDPKLAERAWKRLAEQEG